MYKKNDFGWPKCLPVSEIRPGIRAVSLYTKKGEKLKSVRLLRASTAVMVNMSNAKYLAH